MERETAAGLIESGRAVLGIELGSTRIKAVLVNDRHEPIASGSHDWENRLENYTVKRSAGAEQSEGLCSSQQIWTYHLEDIWSGLQDCYQQLLADVRAKYGVTVTKLGAIGFSAMMHGYMPFDAAGELLVPFRTWRNTMTAEASQKLTELFAFHIPQRWSIAHLYQAMLNKEAHVPQIAYFTTLAGYIHWKLSGEKVLGIGEASGMFPIDGAAHDYRADMLARFDEEAARYGYSWRIRDILPRVLTAGESGGVLTAEGAKLLDISGQLSAGVPLCPPEGDAGTGMAATNSVTVRTGNVSAGTSVFAMVVLERELAKVHEELDIVTTPAGDSVAMVHCNNCTSDLNAWVELFAEFAESMGIKPDKNALYGTLYRKALEADNDGCCGGLLAYNYFSGEHITGFEEGRPLFVRMPESRFSLANFMRAHLYTALGALKVGMDILLKEENVEIDRLYGHGGLFKTEEVGQKIVAAALHAPVRVMQTAGEGGAWGIALLASYMLCKEPGETLEAYLSDKVFAGELGNEQAPDAAMAADFDCFIERYRAGLDIERAAVRVLK